MAYQIVFLSPRPLSQRREKDTGEDWGQGWGGVLTHQLSQCLWMRATPLTLRVVST